MPHQHERAVGRDLGTVLADGVPLAFERITGDVDPGRDLLVGDEHPGRERLHLGDLLGRGVVRRRPEALPAPRGQCLLHPAPEPRPGSPARRA